MIAKRIKYMFTFYGDQKSGKPFVKSAGNMNQFEGPSQAHTAVRVWKDKDMYHITIKEVENGTEFDFCPPTTVESTALFVQHRLVQRMMSTGMWRIIGIAINSDGSQESVLEMLPTLANKLLGVNV